MTHLDGRLKTRIEVVEVDAMFSTRLRNERLPVRHASAGLATHCAQRLVAPDVPDGVLRVSLDSNRSELVVRPESAQAPAERAVAPGRFLGQ